MSGDSNDPVTDLRGLARAIKITVIISLIAQGLVWLDGLISMVMRATGRPWSMPYIEYIAQGLAAATVIGILAMLVCAVLFLIWLGRAHGNLARARLEDVVYRPAWAVGSYFVPVANLIVPPRAMRELWNRSHGEAAWNAQIPVGEVSAWWTCTIVYWLIVGFEIAKAINNAISPVKVWSAADGVLLLFAGLVSVGIMVYIARLTGAITRAQRSLMTAQSIFA